jgi:hypothetical protein|tara:strand:+ start:326 stop:649 length:324 start_codon:yes stop_codon:yes gene_type:complete
MTGQSWHRTVSPECCYHTDCSELGKYVYIGENDKLCERHYNQTRKIELQDEFDTDGYLTARPELAKDRSKRLLNENVLNSLSPSEGGQLDGKDWIEELHENHIQEDK